MGGKSDSMWDDWLIQSKENNPFLCGEWILNIYFNNSSKNSSWVCNAKWEFNDVQLLCLPMNEELAYLCMYLCGLSPFWNCNYTAHELLYWSLIQTAICISCWCKKPRIEYQLHSLLMVRLWKFTKSSSIPKNLFSSPEAYSYHFRFPMAFYVIRVAIIVHN